MNRKLVTLNTCFTTLVVAWSLAPTPAHAGDEDVGVSTSELKVAPGTGKPPPKLYRIRLKNGNRYLDHGCAGEVVLKSGGRHQARCELWEFVPLGDGWYRIKAAASNRYLDADHCTARVGLSGPSGYEGGACQAWRLSGKVNGWSRLQLRHGGQYLDAAYCKERVAMNPGSDYDGGSCQLWKVQRE